MSKTIYIGGRLESKEKGNVVTGANAILDDTKGKKQNVINKETDDELLRLEQSKQDNLNFDNTPTEDSTNPVTSGGVYTAEKALSDAIEAILLLIPSAATALNKLVDTNTMNSSISTATATFRGTYNAVSDLGLTYQATHAQIEAALDALGLTADNNDFAFVQIPVSDQSQDIAKTERFKFNGTNWLYEYDLNTSGFTAAQWAAINSTITLALVQKLAALPTNAELLQVLGLKQDVLTFDNAPTTDSNNPVKSGGIKNAIDTAVGDEATDRENADTALSGLIGDEKTRAEGVEGGLDTRLGAVEGSVSTIQGVIPSEATSSNKLVDSLSMTTYIGTIIDNIDATFNVTSTDGHVTLAITQVNGAITSVQLTTSDIASAAALNLKASQADLTALAGRVTTAEGNITSLTGRMTTAEDDIDQLLALYNALQQSAPQVIQPTDTWPVANPSTTVIYRVIDRVNTPPEYYSDYMWNGTSMVLMATYNNAVDTTPKKDSANLITSGGVFANIGAFDISEYHKSGSTLATYADLTAALAALPSDFQKGGMSIKFVQSSDNKYVQARCMAQNFTTDVTQWQTVDKVPVNGSDNLVNSGGVKKALSSFSIINTPKHFVGTITDWNTITQSDVINNIFGVEKQVKQVNVKADKNYWGFKLPTFDVTTGDIINIEIELYSSISGKYSFTADPNNQSIFKLVDGKVIELSEGINSFIVKLQVVAANTTTFGWKIYLEHNDFKGQTFFYIGYAWLGSSSNVMFPVIEKITKFVADERYDSIIKELYITNTNNKQVYVERIKNNIVILTDETLDTTSHKVAEGAITSDGLIQLSELNNSGVSGYMIIDTNMVNNNYVSISAKALPAAFNVNMSPVIKSLIANISIRTDISNLERKVPNFTEDSNFDNIIMELYLHNPNNIDVYVGYIGGGELIFLDNTFSYANRLATGYIDSKTGFVKIPRANAQGIWGAAIVNLDNITTYESQTAKVTDAGYNISCSPILSAGYEKYNLSKFYSLGDSIADMERWQYNLAMLKNLNYIYTATKDAQYPLGYGGSTICPIIQCEATFYPAGGQVAAVDDNDNPLVDENNKPIYFKIGCEPTHSIYYRSKYFIDHYNDADVVVINAGQNDAGDYAVTDFGNVTDAPYTGLECVSAKWRVIAKYYGGNEHTIAIIDDGTAELEEEYTNGDYTILSAAPKLCPCLAGIIKNILTANPRIKIIGNSLLPCKVSSYAHPEYRVSKYEAIKNLYAAYSIPFADMLHNLGVNELNFSTFFQDDYHPNQYGGDRMAEVIAKLL